MHGFPSTVSFFALMLMTGIAILVTTIPSAPGYLGMLEAASVSIDGVQRGCGRRYSIQRGAACRPLAADHAAGCLVHAVRRIISDEGARGSESSAYYAHECFKTLP